MLGIYVAGGVSGAHLNPAVTVAQAFLGRISWKKVVPYMLSQYVGAFVASACVFLVYHGKYFINFNCVKIVYHLALRLICAYITTFTTEYEACMGLEPLVFEIPFSTDQTFQTTFLSLFLFNDQFYKFDSFFIP
jgi:glycerol uptake facilitator-like aquaporin